MHTESCLQQHGSWQQSPQPPPQHGVVRSGVTSLPLRLETMLLMRIQVHYPGCYRADETSDHHVTPSGHMLPILTDTWMQHGWYPAALEAPFPNPIPPMCVMLWLCRWDWFPQCSVPAQQQGDICEPSSTPVLLRSSLLLDPHSAACSVLRPTRRWGWQ